MSRPWKADEQWDSCGICGFPWPVSDLTVQQTEVSGRSKRCPRCIDNVDNNYREKRIAEFLKQTAKHESRDLRNEPALWFTSADEVN